ncbi:MAG TPA: RluA family pseudouridine synthase, partial [Solirubrobacteraceae bacterium]|nr:RluA family pseudouridine synthase [Solirubrobacteraceae bacterium]
MPGSPLSLTVPPSQDGTRLDRFLAAPLGSRAAAQALIEAHGVRVNGAPRPKRHLLRAGDVVEAVPPKQAEHDGASRELGEVPFTIAFQDEHLLVIDKPAGVVVHPARGHPTDTLAQALSGLAGGGEPTRAGIVHRLDRDTSGLMVVARTDAALRDLQAQWASRGVLKSYLALVVGQPRLDQVRIEAPIGRDPRDRKRMAVTDLGRDATTDIRVLERLGGFALVEARIRTGRT